MRWIGCIFKRGFGSMDYRVTDIKSENSVY